MIRSMIRRSVTLALMSAVAATASVAAPSAALAQPYGYDRGYDADDRGYQPVRHYRGDDRGYSRRGYGDRGYASRGYDDRSGGRGRSYRYNDGRCRDKGTGGTIIGAIAGGLLGNAAVGRRGDNTAGAIVGAGVGALAGRSIDRSDGRPC